MRRNDAVGRDRRQTEPPGRSQYRMTGFAGPELGIEIGGSAQLEDLLENTDVPREEDQAISVGSE
jgi:hypothetical protein